MSIETETSFQRIENPEALKLLHAHTHYCCLTNFERAPLIFLSSSLKCFLVAISNLHNLSKYMQTDKGLFLSSGRSNNFTFFVGIHEINKTFWTVSVVTKTPNVFKDGGGGEKKRRGFFLKKKTKNCSI